MTFRLAGNTGLTGLSRPQPLAPIASFAEAIGDRPVDLLYNNAGIDARAVGAEDGARGALDLTEQQFRSVLDVNVLGPWLMVKALVENLRAAAGTVVKVSSQVGSIEVAQTIGRTSRTRPRRLRSTLSR